MERYFVWYVRNDGVKGKYGGYPTWLPKAQIPDDIWPSLDFKTKWWFKTRAEAERIAGLMRQDNGCFVKVWVSRHNT